MSVLGHLEPKKVLGFFEEMCNIPHGSGNTKKISDYLVKFAKARCLEYYQDSANNVIIIKNAIKGYENASPVILQGHMDMVCEKAPDSSKDMETEGVDLVVDGDIVSADGTTLGADNGVACAMMLAILDSDDIAHPRLEAVFTVDEEIGMLGAAVLDVSMLKGKTMLNIDSEDEGIFTVSCAGGNLTKCTLPVVREIFDGDFYEIKVSGLTGGHSGIEIDKGRANSNMLIGRVLYEISSETEMRIAKINGGLKDNAIPVETTAVFAVSRGYEPNEICLRLNELFRNEYKLTDDGVTVEVSPCPNAMVMDKVTTDNVLYMMSNLPNGVVKMSEDIKGLVQTSLNLGICKTSDAEFYAAFCVRSSVESEKNALVDTIKSVMAKVSGNVIVEGDYPGWEYRKNSPLRDLMCDVFNEQYGYMPKVEAIHAGVECGMFAGKIPDLDCVSYGPSLKEIHTFREHMDVKSVERVWKMTLEILKRMK